MGWGRWRRDDHPNELLIRAFADRATADAARDEHAARGHDHRCWLSDSAQGSGASPQEAVTPLDASAMYRRDPAVRLPLEQFGRRRGDVPFLCAEVVLLYKSKQPTSADEADFRAAQPHLSEPQRRWLRRALEICAPRHHWLGLMS